MLVGAVGGLRDATKITAAKLQALDGNNQGVSTLNAVNMLGWTGDNMNQSLATAIWKDRLKVSYKDMEGYGKYTQGEDKIVISSTLLGGGSEGSAKLAAAFSHEGTHFFGNRVEGLAHMQAAGTYDTINRMFGLESNTDFSNEMIDGILDSRSWVENTGISGNPHVDFRISNATNQSLPFSSYFPMSTKDNPTAYTNLFVEPTWARQYSGLNSRDWQQHDHVKQYMLDVYKKQYGAMWQLLQMTLY